MLNIAWKPISEADKSKTIIGVCPEWMNPNGFVYPEHLTVCYWWKGDSLNKPGWTSSSLLCFPTHFIYYEELHQSYKDQVSDNHSQQ